MSRDYKREIYTIELIRTGILFLDIMSIRAIGGYYPYDASRSMVLYTLESFEDGYLPLNREYKPLGISRYMDYVKYEDFGFLKIPKEYLDLSVLNDNLYTFNDCSYPGNAKNKKKYKGVIDNLFKNKIDFTHGRGYE